MPVPAPTVSEKLGAVRMARLRHCDEMRARRAPPKTQSLGLLVSSRFRFDGAKFWIMCSSINILRAPLFFIRGIGRFFIGGFGRSKAVEAVRPGPANARLPIGMAPCADILEELEPVHWDILLLEHGNRLPQVDIQLFVVGCRSE